MSTVPLKSLKSIGPEVKICCIFGYDPAAEAFIQREIRRYFAIGAVYQQLSMIELLKVPSRLSDYFCEPSLFAERNLLEVFDCKDQLSKHLKAIAPIPQEQDNHLLIFAPTIRKSSSLLKVIEDRGDCLAISAYDFHLTLSQLEDLIPKEALAKISTTSRKHIEAHLNDINISAVWSFAAKLSLLLLQKENDEIDQSMQAFLDTEDTAIDRGLTDVLLRGDIDSLIQQAVRSSPLSDDNAAALASTGYQFLAIYLNTVAGGRPGKPIFWKLQRLLDDVQRRNSDLTTTLERSLVDITDHDRSTRSAQTLSDIELHRLLIRLALRFSVKRQ